jgi:hypothetical protein
LGLVSRPVFDLLYSSFQERRISCDILNGKAHLLATSAGELPGRCSALLSGMPNIYVRHPPKNTRFSLSAFKKLTRHGM